MGAATTNIPVEFVPAPLGSSPQIVEVKRPSRKRRAVISITPVETPIQREWRMWHTVIPATSCGYGKRRSAYFYRKMAITLAQDARRYGWYSNGEARQTFISLAKSYLKTYRQMKGASS